MQNQTGRLAVIHIAKKQLALDEEAYRAILSGAGLSSAKDIATDAQFNAVMDAFSRLGFRPQRGRGVKHQSTAPGAGPGMISKRQEYYIRGLWDLASRAKDEKSLRRIIKRIGKVDDLSFLPRRSAQAVILALRDICWKAGYNPDTQYKEDPHVESQTDRPVSGPETPPDLLPPGDGRDRGRQTRQGLAGTPGSGGGL